ncbi:MULTISPECIES: EAL domain-containing protein [unclassified Beijerinckia]|uniref:EAL domain-containing protein n=1 Tax=unclassified Beijerinckia TaxID=2638183 RepID=UPI00089666BA|nr:MULTISPECIES: EAL domain-containing protein [unclassified Beijerinckia]MDH7795420.1 sensor c-di-GMP phosphodiesterase-like protein [Beijerinckia sp. GAS462]SEC00814.1 sensor c-di-GMP phosphodiesterase, contains CSS-motif sensor and EAL domain [Beijerinckia sp. 28-YEA-48]
MDARRFRIIAAAILLGLLGAIIPIATMAYTSWAIALGKEQDALNLLADRAIQRAAETFKDAKLALESIEAAALPPCSDAHIMRMRMITLNTEPVEEIGYFENGLLKCTSWGMTEGMIPKSRVDYTTPDGIGVNIRIQPGVTRAKQMTALNYGSYNALVAPSRFLDIMVEDGVSLALTNEQGMVINTLNAPDLTLVKDFVGTSKKGMTDTAIYAVARHDGLMAIAMEPRAQLADRLRGERLLLLPMGAFIAAFIVGTVIWLSRKRLSPLAELEIAVRKREFIVHYQPIIELKTGICMGAEALVRWRRPDGTLVRPDLFIPLAEESGLILPITDQVLDAVIFDLNRILIEDRTLHIAVNLCAADITTGRVLDALAEKLPQTGIRTAQIWLEATERGFIDIEAAKVTLAKARALGHSVAIDDFGTGYSNLQHLQGLPLDALKIDKSFIDTVGRNTATSSVTSHIIDMAKALGLFTVAEGIESEDQADYLRAHGVDFGQGWLFSKPLSPAEFIAYHRSRKQKYGAAPEVIHVGAV